MKFAFNLLLLLFLFVNSIFSQGLIDVQPAGINWENGQVNNNEPSIAINPADINNIILATNHRVLGINGCGSNATKSLGIYRSLDKGATWSTPYTMPRTHNLSYYADPSIAFSSDGTAYCGYLGEGGNTSVIFVNYSTNKGISWSYQPYEIGYENATNITNDKPYLHTDKIYNKIYMAYTKIENSDHHIMISHYDNGIQNFSQPIGESNPGTQAPKFGAIPVTDKNENKDNFLCFVNKYQLIISTKY